MTTTRNLSVLLFLKLIKLLRVRDSCVFQRDLSLKSFFCGTNCINNVSDLTLEKCVFLYTYRSYSMYVLTVDKKIAKVKR